jgi:nicotinamidase-related amidase
MAYVNPKNLTAKAKLWLNRIAPFNTHEMALRREQSCLLVIDMQRYFVDPKGAAFLPGAQAVLGNVQRLIRAFRAAGRPVIYTRHVHHPDRLDAGIMAQWWGDMIMEGTPDSEIYHALAPLENEKVVTKHRYSAFYNTDLELILRVLKTEDLALCGVMTNLCCESTARDAFHRDFRVFFHADATATDTEEMHMASLLNLSFGFSFVTTADRTIRDLNLECGSLLPPCP